MEEEKSETKQPSSNHRRKILAGLLTTAITAAGIGGYNYFNQEEELPPPKPKVVKESNSAQGIGYIDLERLNDKLPNLESLSELKRQEARLRLELKDAMRPVIITPPKIDNKPFDDSVWQKNAQTIISEAAEISKRKKQAAEDYRKSTEEEYLKKRDAANDQFLNEVLNIKLKLQNADNMRLSSEDIAKLERRLAEIQIERNEIQKQIMEQWIQEINTAAEEAVKDDIESLKAQADAAKLKVEKDAVKAQSEAIERNKQIMEQAMQESTARQERRQQLMVELRDINSRRTEIEGKVFDSAGDLIAKLAVIHKLKLVLVKRDFEDNEKFIPLNIGNEELAATLIEDMRKSTSGAVLFAGSEGIDLTDELIKELDTQAMFNKGN